MATYLPARTVRLTHRDYVRYLQSKLVKAEAGLTEMNDKYDRAKARFDRCQARRGITPENGLIGYIDVKAMNPELKYWYAKVEHFQREVAAYGTALTGLEAARRMLGVDGRQPRPQPRPENNRARDGRRGLSRAS